MLFWFFFDYGLAVLAVLFTSDALIRFGVGSPVLALVYGMTVLRVALSPRLQKFILSSNVPMFVYPAACAASVLWSASASSSLISSIQLFATIVIAIVIGSRFNVRTLLPMIFFTLGVPIIFPW